ncbi:MAG: hypothetical protein JWR80_7599 [Bradyrhizobium sp.]|nr:hypothetical protein [Bradyrhizobium sp.]
MPARASVMDQSLACRVEGTGPDLVLLHGGVGSWTHWIRNIPVLAAAYRVHAYDLPGFGDSASFTSADDAAYFQLVADAIHEGCEGPIRLVGFSFGGTVAAAVAPLLGGRLAALTLVAPGSFGQPDRSNIDVRPLQSLAGADAGKREAARHNLNEVMFADPASADDVTIDLHLANIDRARFKSRRLSWQDRIERDLAPISCPIQMIWGDADRMAWPSVDARVERCRGASRPIRFDLIPGGGHWVQYEQADAFNAALLDFQAGIAG